MYRVRDGAVQVLLAHPGGPFWARKDIGAWSLPKGQYESPEEPLDAACREFTEETGFTPRPPFLPLGEVRQKSGKRVQAWAFEGDCDCAKLSSNTFEVEWPPRSGRMQTFAEVDRIEWFDLARARTKLLPAQVPFLDRLGEALAA
jgi:predicted NUDIX family NTP pyrophosphohydrolase